jgi:hypothetical protein
LGDGLISQRKENREKKEKSWKKSKNPTNLVISHI